MSTRTLWKIKVDIHQVYNLRLGDSTELPDPYIAASLILPHSLDSSSGSAPVQRTAAKSKMSTGTFSAVMLFVANVYDFNFDRIKIHIRVHNSKKLTELLESDGGIIGTSTFSLTNIYEQTNHWLPREWLPITSPSSPGDCRGYIQVSLGVFGPGDDVPIQLSDFQLSSIGAGGKDSLSRSLVEKIVQTPETNFHNSMLIFNIHRAEHLPILQTASGLMAPSSGYVRVSFVGIQSITRVIGSNANPAWNESIRIPVLFPSWDKFVIVEVFSSSGNNKTDSNRRQPSAESASSISSSDILLGTAIFDFDTLYRQGIQATWFNIYRSPASMNPGFGALYGPEYSGRVQVSATVARSSDLNASVVPFDITTINEPLTEEIVLFVDIYELDFMDEAIRPEEIPREIWLQIQFGPNSFESARIANCGMTCIFEGDAIGRFGPIRLHLPLDREMAFDMIISIYGQNNGEEKRRLCFARIGIDRFLVTAQSGGVVPQVDPEWLQLSWIQRGKGSGTILSGVVDNVTDTVNSGFTLISDGFADIANSFFGAGSAASPSRPNYRRAETSGVGQKRIEDSLVRVSNVLASIMAVRTSIAIKGSLTKSSASSSTATKSNSSDISTFISSDITAEMIIKRRPPRVVYEMKPYELRFCAHQACNLPIADKRNLTNAICRVTLAGVSTRTSVVPTTLYPIWNEALKIEVDLPQNSSIRPDVIIEVVHLTDSKEEVVLGVSSMKTVSLKPTLAGPPSWFKLHPPNQSFGVEQESYVLCSAVLVPASESTKYAVPSPLPVRSTFTTDLLIVGVRLLRNYSIEHLNKIELSWGRHRANLRKKVVTVRSADPVSGEGGQFNFFQPVMLDLDLPIDSVFQEFIEVRLFELQQGDQDETIGFGFIHLNPHYSWLSDSEKAQYRNLFRMKTHEEIRREEELRALEAAKKQQRNRGGLDQVKVETRRRRMELTRMKNMDREQVELAYIENEIDGLYGLDTRDNYVALPLQYFNAVETEALFPSRFKVRSTARRSIGGTDNDENGYNQYDVSAAGRSAANRQDENEIKRLNPQFLSDFVWEPAVSRDSQENLRKVIDGDIESSEVLPNFATTLPFIYVPIVIGSPIGSESFVVVGYLKVKVVVREKSASSNELMGWKNDLIDQYERSRKLMARIYAIRAEGIVPSSSGSTAGTIIQNSTSSYFLWVRNVAGDLVAEYPTCSIKDDGALVIEGGVNPEFNKCFQLPCSLPENALLFIELYERVQTAVLSTAAAAAGIGDLVSSSTDTLIGTVVIDLENRWFSPKYKQLVASGEIPIETLTLRTADSSGIPKGKLKLWVELMDQVTSMGRPIEIMPSPQPESMEVRIALWRTRGVPNAEGEDQCHQGVIVYMQNLDSQSSDTHYGSMDGTGTFNWRFVFNPSVPTEDGSIRFQLHHRPLVAISNVPIGEVSIDISHELAVVRRTRRSIDLPRTWVPLSHPSFVGKLRGTVEIAVRILTSEEARSFPVGKGRDSPNQDPFLDPDDPHLVQHRSILANTNFGRSFMKFVENLKSGFKIATIIFIIGCVIAGIVGIIVFLYSMGIIKIGGS